MGNKTLNSLNNMNVIKTMHEYEERCEKLNKDDEIVRPDFNAQEMNYEVEMYSPGELHPLKGGVLPDSMTLLA